MGEEGARLTPAAVEAAERLVDDLQALGEVTWRRMLGGFGIYAGGTAHLGRERLDTRPDDACIHVAVGERLDQRLVVLAATSPTKPESTPSQSAHTRCPRGGGAGRTR